MNTSTRVLALIAALAAPAGALAAVTVTTDRGMVIQNTFSGATGKWTIVVKSNDAAGPTTFDILANANDRIAYIGVQASNAGQVTKLNIKGLNNQPLLRSVDLIERVAGTDRDVWLNDLRTTEDVGSIKVTTIVDAQVGGSVTGDVDLIFRQNGGESSLLSMTVAGNVLGNVQCPYGSIFNLVVGGRIGDPGPGNESLVRVRNTIEHLVAGDIYANISTTAYGNPGYTGHLEATTAGGGGGVFSGRLITNAFFGGVNPGLFVRGSLQADISVAFAHNTPTAEIVLPAGGLSRQIIFNAANSGGTWVRPVKIGFDGDPNQIILTGDNYAPTAAAIGGGAVGLAPFKLHKSACTPPDAGVAPASIGAASPLILRHYGPIKWTAPAAPVSIEGRPAGSAGPWINVTTDFAFSLASFDREIHVTKLPTRPGFVSGNEYRIRPVRLGSGALKSAGVTGEPLVVINDPAQVGYTYTFRVAGSCPADFDADGLVGSADLALMLGAWGCSGACPADLDGLTGVGSADLALLLGAWGACP